MKPFFRTLVPLLFAIAGFTAQPPTGAGAGAIKINPKDVLKYVWIPPGRFTMGCSAGDTECQPDEKPAHEVTITKGFWLNQSPVTQAAYRRVIGSNPLYFSAPYVVHKGDRMPAYPVSWNEARNYCRAIGGRLPTEAEWEYAARAGTTGARYGALDEIAWYGKNSGGRPHDVGQRMPNAFGLYDMLGNVVEWVNDRYDEAYYQQRAGTDPAGPAVGSFHAPRGTGWSFPAIMVRVSVRNGNRERARAWDAGVRCVME